MALVLSQQAYARSTSVDIFNSDFNDPRSLEERLKEELSVLREPSHGLDFMERHEFYADIFWATSVTAPLDPKKFGSSYQEIELLKHKSDVETLIFFISWFKEETKEGYHSSVISYGDEGKIPIYEKLFKWISGAMNQKDKDGKFIFSWSEIGITDEGRSLKERCLRKVVEKP